MTFLAVCSINHDCHDSVDTLIFSKKCDFISFQQLPYFSLISVPGAQFRSFKLWQVLEGGDRYNVKYSYDISKLCNFLFQNNNKWSSLGAKYSRMGQVKSVEDSLWKIYLGHSWILCPIPELVGNKAKGRILQRVFQENKADFIFRKKRISITPWYAHLRVRING